MRTSKSPVRILKTALAIGSRTFRLYSHRCSPKTFTQPQLFAFLVLKEAMKLDYRGVAALLAPPGRGPRPDLANLAPSCTQASGPLQLEPPRADAGYAAEWIPVFVRFALAPRPLTPAEHGRKSASPPVGYHRRLMRFRLN